MQRTAVASSDLCSVGYDKETQVLEIEFQAGGVYQYFDVPESVHQALLDAPSKGKYFHRNIKNSFKWRKVG